MKIRIGHLWKMTAVVLMLVASPLLADAGNTKPLLDMSVDGVEKRFTPDFGSEGQVSVARSRDAAAPGLVVSIEPGKAGYPGVCLKPEGAATWDLSAFGHVEARMTNLGTKPAGIALRVDNAGSWQEGPWNTEQVWLAPGKTGTVSVMFGFSYGHKPGYALKPAAVANILFFLGKADVPQSFRIDSLIAAGPAGEKPPVDPASVRTVPKDGILLGEGTTLDAKQVVANGAQAALVADGTRQSLRITLPAAKGDQSVTLKPSIGRWDLRAATQVRVNVKNEGQTSVTPRVQVASENKPTDLITGKPLEAGAQEEIVVPFTPATPWTGIPNSGNKTSWDGVKGTGTQFCSDKVDVIKVSAEHTGPATLLVTSVVADAAVCQTPAWLGQRPPVEGQWTKTFDEEFDGNAIDLTKWNIYAPNYWDQATRWSKDNTIIGDGVVKLRYEKKTGFHNDDPKEKQKNYTSGFLDTYGKWVQRYGYFEARMKLPKAPGLWPAFWLMPDRGVNVGPQWKRQDTANGGMEFDVMEHLTRWGPYRYNIAMHWDGYQKEHKQTGCTTIYVTPDKDGFITSGLLWTPGVLVFYCNGQEVARWEDPRISSVQANMMFTLPMGGWDNNALDNARLPDDFVIDYVRAWQLKDLASPVDGPQAPATQPAAK